MFGTVLTLHPALFAGLVVGAVVGVIAGGAGLALRDGKGRLASFGAVAVAVFLVTLGMLGTWTANRDTNRFASGAGLSPTQRALLLDAGHEDAGYLWKLGLAAAAIPMLLGVAGVVRRPVRPAALSAMARPETPPFQRVWRIVESIPRGRVTTYGQISRAIAGRLTPVGVGWALRAAPAGAIPWQRVVNASGGVSTDTEHPGRQRRMLEREGVVFGVDGKIDLSRYGWEPKPAPRRPAK